MTPRLVTEAPLAHLQAGDGPRLAVLLHGIGGGRAGWPLVVEALAAAGWRVAAVDLPGYGASAAVAPGTGDADADAAAPPGLAPIAQRVAALIDALAPPATLVVGHSLGGMVALELAAASPRHVQALALLGSSPAFGRPDGAWQRAFLSERLAPLEAGLGMAGLAAQLVPAMTAPGASKAARDAAVALMAGVPEATYRAMLAALVGFDRRAALPSLRMPALVLTGEHDRAAPPEVARRLAAALPAARLQLLPDAGHLAPLEQPAAVAEALRRFAATCFE